MHIKYHFPEKIPQCLVVVRRRAILSWLPSTGYYQKWDFITDSVCRETIRQWRDQNERKWHVWPPFFQRGKRAWINVTNLVFWSFPQNATERFSRWKVMPPAWKRYVIITEKAWWVDSGIHRTFSCETELIICRIFRVPPVRRWACISTKYVWKVIILVLQQMHTFGTLNRLYVILRIIKCVLLQVKVFLRRC